MYAQPLVSIIVIFYDGEKFITEAILSILAQTHGHWEILLVDDGSSDRSVEISQEFVRNYPGRIRYLEHERHQNLGMSASRNLGLANAKGEYIAFLDSDDIWLPEKLEKQIELFQQYPEASVVCGPTKLWYGWSGDPRDAVLDSILEIVREYNRLYKPGDLLKQLLLNRARTPATCSVLIRRSLLRKVGGFEDQFKGLYEDQVFFSKVYLKANIFVCSDYWDLYRQHSENHCLISEETGQGTPGHLNEKHRQFLRWLESYLLAEEVEDPDLLKVLHKALWAYENKWLYYILNPEQFFRMIGRFALPLRLRQKLWKHYILIRGSSL